MITYIYHKDSTLWAFEGPEKRTPNIHDYGEDCGYAYDCRRKEEAYNQAMSTARESALPVVNANDVWKHIRLVEITSWWKIDDKGKISDELKPGETIALPGWALEKEYQALVQFDDGKKWMECRKVYFDRTENRKIFRQAYRLKRSEPDGIEMNHAVVDEFTKPIPIKLTFYSGKLWHSDKPFPVKPDPMPYLKGLDWEASVKTWLSTAYEVVNPEVIPITPDGYSTRIKDGDQITLPDGYGIDTHSHLDGNWKGATITLPEKPEPFGETKLCPIHQDRNCVPECVNGCVYGNRKPDNSAYGCPKCRTTDFNSCHSMYCPMRKESVVEPSESQEEKRYTELEVRLIANQCVNEYAGHLASNGCDVLPFDEFNINEWLDEKLTRK